MAELPPPSGPPAGWYPDPYDPRRQRYWDGREWDLSSTPTTVAPFGRGAADDYPDIGEWLDRSFRSAYRRWRAVLALAVLTAPIISICTNIAIDRLADGLVISEDGVDGWTNDRLPTVIVLGAIVAVVSIVSGLAMYRLMLDAIDGDDPDDTTVAAEIRAALFALWRGLVATPRAVGWSLLLGLALVAAALVVALFAVAAGPAALVVVLVLLPLVVFLAVRWAFFVTAVVDGPGNPFSRSSEVSRGRWWSTLGRLLLLGIIVWLISLVIQLLGALIGGDSFSGLGSGSTFEIDSNGEFDPIVLDDEISISVWGTIVGIVTSVLGSVLVTSVAAAATALLYRTRNPRS
jgi:hypothetical protein